MIIPKMEVLHPGFEFVAAPEQTDAWKKLRKSDSLNITTQSPSSLDRWSIETEISPMLTEG